jgi:excisionase family DNA binding protein
MTTRLVYDIEEAAEQLGCSVAHVYRLISAGALKQVNIRATGKKSKARIRHEDLVAFINSRLVA